MSILVRMVRMFRADIHGVMDQLEDKGLLLKQYLRDMETALVQKEARLRSLMASRRHLQQDLDKRLMENAKLEKDLTLAIEKDRDDIARTLIKRLRPLARLRDELEHQLDALDQEIAQLKDCIEQQRAQYGQIKRRTSEYFQGTEQEKWDKTLSPSILHSSYSEPSEGEVELELLQRKEALKGGSMT